MSKDFDTGMIVGAVWKFEKLMSREFDRVIKSQELPGYTPQYFDGSYERVIAKIDEDFPLSLDLTSDGLLKNVANFTFKGSKALLDINWREHVVYSYIMIILGAQLANFAPYPSLLYWKSRILLSVGAFLSHGSIIGRNFDALEDQRISEIKNIYTAPSFSDSALFKNMFCYKSDSNEFVLAKEIIVWNLILDIDMDKILQPGRLELGLIACETSKHWRNFEKLGPMYEISSFARSSEYSYTFEGVLSDMLSVKRKTTELLNHSSVQLADEGLQKEFLRPAMRVAEYFLNYPSRTA